MNVAAVVHADGPLSAPPRRISIRTVRWRYSSPKTPSPGLGLTLGRPETGSRDAPVSVPAEDSQLAPTINAPPNSDEFVIAFATRRRARFSKEEEL